MESDTSIPVQLRTLCNILETPNGHQFLSFLGNLDGKRINEMCSRYLNELNDNQNNKNNHNNSPILEITTPTANNNTRKRSASTNIDDVLDVEAVVDSMIETLIENEKRQLLERQKQLVGQINDSGMKSSSGFREKALVEEKIMVKKRLRTLEEAEGVQVCLDVINLEATAKSKPPPPQTPKILAAPSAANLFTPDKLTQEKTMFAAPNITTPMLEDSLMERIDLMGGPAKNLQTLAVYDNFQSTSDVGFDESFLETFLEPPGGISIQRAEIQIPTSSSAYDVATQFNSSSRDVGRSSPTPSTSSTSSSSSDANSLYGNASFFVPVDQYLDSDPHVKIGTRVQKDQFNCCRCTKICRTRAKLLVHSTMEHRVGIVNQCFACGKCYTTETTFRKHKCAALQNIGN
ncbi:unnamed protein product [Caenorhabditis angaria]|uniref:Uncharacterized protein n=1 Tax=Caenorhabditis angaria TaxID=860376 RepID=A0A9P1I9E5_9PELO|nr:unnamed protein product [Caenorhabditis angaria]